jgi:peptidoglycan/LPS O-acetylase OafA/YrhL
MDAASPPAVARLPGIEGLRGVLALWVLFSHTVTASGLGEDWRGPFRVLYVGTHAVDAFIIVSGFVIFFLLDTARERPGVFLRRRALRLYPVYLACLLVSAALLPMQLRVYGEAPFPHPHTAYLVAIVEASIAQLPLHLAAHLAMVHAAIPPSMLPHANYAILHPGWSLSLEWQFYLLAPLVFAMLLRGGASALLVIGGACAAHFLLAGPQGFLPLHVPEFALGIACYMVWRRRPALSWPLLLPAGMALAYLTTHDPAVVVWMAVFLAALAPRAAGAATLNGVLQSAPLQALGRWSYAVYLSHTIVLVLAMDALRAAGMPVMGQWAYFGALLAATLCGTLVVSAALHRWVEAPCIAFGRRIAARGPRAPA